MHTVLSCRRFRSKYAVLCLTTGAYRKRGLNTRRDRVMKSVCQQAAKSCYSHDENELNARDPNRNLFLVRYQRFRLFIKIDSTLNLLKIMAFYQIAAMTRILFIWVGFV